MIREVLEKPEVVLEELETQQEGQLVLEEEIGRTTASIRRLANQERRLIRLYGMGHVTEEYLVREAQGVKKARSTLESELTSLQERRRRLRHLDGLGDRVRAFCNRVAKQLDEFDFEKKRLALQALQIRIVVGWDGARLSGAIPADLATIERTWA